MKIGEIIQRLGFINEMQLETVIREQEESKKNSMFTETLGNILLRRGFITEDQHNKILVEYYRSLAEDAAQPAYVKETAKVAMQAMSRRSSSERLAEESKLTLLKQIYENEEKIRQYEKSIQILKNLEQKKVIIETIAKADKEIKLLISRIESLRKDLEKFS